MAKLKWIVEFSVEESWVAGGFDLTEQRALDMLANDLSYAYSVELDARVLSAPDAEKVAKAQGYKDTKEVERVRKEGRLHRARKSPGA